MGKIITEKDFWMCTEGAMPAPIQGTRTSNKKEGGDEVYITVADTATLSTIDFGCTKFMLFDAIIAAIAVVVVAVVVSAFIVATGGAGLGLLALVAIGAGGGLVGGVIGMVQGNMKCGQKNASVRQWSDKKGDLLWTKTPSITSDHIMTCKVGGTVMFAPNIKSWSDARKQAALSYTVTFLECGLAGAGIGLGGGVLASAFTGLTGVATLSESVAIIAPTKMSIFINTVIMGATKGASGYNQYERGEAWGMDEDQKLDMAIPEREAFYRIRENGYQSITGGDIILFGSDLIGPFVNIKTSPSVAAAKARAAYQAKTAPKIQQNPENFGEFVDTPENTPGSRQEPQPKTKTEKTTPVDAPENAGTPPKEKPRNVKGEAFENPVTSGIRTLVSRAQSKAANAKSFEELQAIAEQLAKDILSKYSKTQLNNHGGKSINFFESGNAVEGQPGHRYIDMSYKAGSEGAGKVRPNTNPKVGRQYKTIPEDIQSNGHGNCGEVGTRTQAENMSPGSSRGGKSGSIDLQRSTSTDLKPQEACSSCAEVHYKNKTTDVVKGHIPKPKRMK